MEFVVARQYLNLPVRNGAPMRRMRLVVGGRTFGEFDIELAEGSPDFYVFAEIEALRDQTLRVEVDGEAADAFVGISQSDTIEGAEDLYAEALRPQFHFSTRRGWINDPNGLVFLNGEYHLFYQHNPYGWKWANMHWGHAVSPDLVHWRELPDAIAPDRLGAIYSGSAVVDRRNTAGFGDDALVCIYTSAGAPFTQSIACSTDHGRTLRKFEGNPVLGHVAGTNRDPKVIWHEPTGKWVMALYLEESHYALFGSPDLKQWTRLCDVELLGDSECPDFFELPVDGDAADTRWVFWGASGTYALGTFDGTTFRPEGEPRQLYRGGNSYAAQTWSGIPAEDGRRIQIAWARMPLPGMPFNQHTTFPCRLTLRGTPAGLGSQATRLISTPVREIELLHDRRYGWRNQVIEPGTNLLSEIRGELFDIRADLALGDAAQLRLTVRGATITYDCASRELSCADKTVALEPVDDRLRLQVLVDRTSIEIFGNDGALYLPIGVLLADGPDTLELCTTGGRADAVALDVYELHSAWEPLE